MGEGRRGRERRGEGGKKGRDEKGKGDRWEAGTIITQLPESRPCTGGVGRGILGSELQAPISGKLRVLSSTLYIRSPRN